MTGSQEYEVLSGANSRDSLIEHAKRNGVKWEEHPHEGVNWMRASRAMVRHLNSGKQIDTDDMDPETIKVMLDHYKVIRDHHKKTMVPHVRSAMYKLYSEKGDPSLNPTDLINEAHAHLRENGGRVWAEKVSTLSHLNNQISKLSEKLAKTKRQM